MNNSTHTKTISTNTQKPLTVFVYEKSGKSEVFKKKNVDYPHNSHPLLQLSIKI